jgi:hypothetical protein
MKAKGVSAAHKTRATIPVEEEIGYLITSLEQRSRIRSSEASTKSMICQDGDTVKGQPAICEDGLGRDDCVLSSAKRLFVFAFDRDTLKRFMSEYLACIKSHFQCGPTEMAIFLKDFAYMLSERRSRFRWNKFVVAGSYSELVYRLSGVIGLSEGPSLLRAIKVIFVFTGQGAQYARMGMQLLVYPVFRKSLEDATVYMEKVREPMATARRTLTRRKTFLNQQPCRVNTCSCRCSDRTR